MWLDQQLAWRRSVANLRRATAVIAISRAVADDVVETLRVPDSRVHVVYPSVVIEPPSERDGPARDPDHVLFVGAPDPHKNLHVLLQALSTMPRSTTPGLTIVGPWSSRAESLLRRAQRQLGLQRIRIERDASVARLEHLYRTATVLVLPSRREGFGIPLLEAMAHGCPVIAADLRVLREVAGGAALHVPVNDVDALREAVMAILSDRERRSRMAAAGLARAAAFDPEVATDALLACYRSIGFSLAA